jgi:hypothetical protein
LLPQRSMKIPPYPPLAKGGWGDFHINDGWRNTNYLISLSSKIRTTYIYRAIYERRRVGVTENLRTIF